MILIAIARGIYFTLLMLLFGSAAFETLLKKRLPIIAALRLQRGWVLLLALIAACAWFIPAHVLPIQTGRDLRPRRWKISLQMASG